MIAEPKFSDSSPEALAAYTRQAALYASLAGLYRPSIDPFEVPGTTAHREIEEALSWANSE